MNWFRLVTTLVASLSMAMAFSHLLQLPPRMSFDGATWITTQRLFTLYGSIGGMLEVGAVILTAILAYRTRGTRSFRWTLPGALLFATALLVWIVFVAPANTQISQWSPANLGADWTRWRVQWEYAHAVRAVLLIVGLGCLIQSLLVDPGTRNDR